MTRGLWYLTLEDILRGVRFGTEGDQRHPDAAGRAQDQERQQTAAAQVLGEELQ